MLAEVRDQPWRGRSHDADGRPMRVKVTPSTLVDVVFVATFTPAFYRELTAALRSGLRGDRAPLLRLVAEATGGGTDSGPARAYSGGLEAAVSCHDYPYVYDLTTPPGAAAGARVPARAPRGGRAPHPNTYGPFTVCEYADSGWQGLDWCTQLADRARRQPGRAGPAAGRRYPDVPVLVLSGELDSITTPAEGRMVARPVPRRHARRGAQQLPRDRDRRHRRLRRTRSCGRSSARPRPSRPSGDGAAPRRWSRSVRPGIFPRDAGRRAARPRRGSACGSARAPPRPLPTVADLPGPLVEQLLAGTASGCAAAPGPTPADAGGRSGWTACGWSAASPSAARRSGTGTPRPCAVDLDLAGAVTGHITGRWDTRRVGAQAMLRGRIGGERVAVRFPAP